MRQKDLLKHFLPLCLVPSLLALTGIHRLGGGDVWWHIRLGEALLAGVWPPNQDLFSYTAEGPLTYVEPLSDVLFYSADQVAGHAGLIGLKVTILFLLGLCLISSTLITIPKRDVHRMTFVMVMGLTAAALQPRMIVRPFLFSWVIFALFIALLHLARRKQIATYLWLLPGITVLWTNTHRSAVLAFFLVGLFYAFQWKSDGHPSLKRTSLWVCLLTIGAVMVQPAGDYALYSPFQALFASPDVVHIEEWATLTFPIMVNEFPFFIFISLIWIAGWATHRRAFDFGSALVLVFLVASYEIRFIPFATIVMFPGLLWDVETFRKWLQERFGVRDSILSFSMLGLGLSVTAAGHFFMIEPEMEGVGTARWVPTHAADFLHETPPPGPMYNDYNVGGYLLYRLSPKQPVFVDPRTQNTLYSPDFLRTVWKAPVNEEAFKKLQRQHRFKFAVIPFSQPQGYAHLLKKREWAMVYWDDAAAIFVLQDEETKAYVREYGYVHLRMGQRWDDIANGLGGPHGHEWAQDIIRNKRQAPHSRRAEFVYLKAMKVKPDVMQKAHTLSKPFQDRDHNE